MPRPYRYAYKFQPRLDELIELRRKRYPDVMQKDFAATLGITRLHLVNIERSRKRARSSRAFAYLFRSLPCE